MSTKNIFEPEAKEKMTNMVNNIKFAMMATNLGSKPLGAVPMATKKVDDQGNIWFLSSKESDHNKQLAQDQHLQLLYSDPSDMEFVSVYGKAFVETDKELLKDLYNEKTDVWFDGPYDPNLSAIKVEPEEAYYWDTKHNKYVTLLKMGASAVTGNKTDIGEKGKLNL